MFTHEATLVVKRVIGTAGDVVEGREFQVFVNGKQLKEPYVQHVGPKPPGMKTLGTFGPVTVPPSSSLVITAITHSTAAILVSVWSAPPTSRGGPSRSFAPTIPSASENRCIRAESQTPKPSC